MVGRLSSSARLSDAGNAGKARNGESLCIVARCDEGPLRFVDAVGTVCPDAALSVAVPGRAWCADGCSMGRRGSHFLGNNRRTSECASIRGFCWGSLYDYKTSLFSCKLLYPLAKTHLKLTERFLQEILPSGLRPKSDKFRQGVDDLSGSVARMKGWRAPWYAHFPTKPAELAVGARPWLI